MSTQWKIMGEVDPAAKPVPTLALFFKANGVRLMTDHASAGKWSSLGKNEKSQRQPGTLADTCTYTFTNSGLISLSTDFFRRVTTFGTTLMK
jgi:hypothetical protein